MVLSFLIQKCCASTSPAVWVFPDPNNLLGMTPIKVVKEAKFFGLIFDTKLTCQKYVQYLKYSCQKALDIL